jgi:IMP and pyridine-specific 5'-nucleotidase
LLKELVADLMSHGTKIGIVTAAGYTDAEKYYGRLHGLLEAIKASSLLTPAQKGNIVIMGKRQCPSLFPPS